MTIHHHPDDATLLSYAAGSLLESFQILVSCHLQHCQRCRQQVADAELIGTALITAVKPTAVSQRKQFVELLEQEATNVSHLNTDLDGSISNQAIPAHLAHFFKNGDKGLPWHKLVAGIQQIGLNTVDKGLKLLKIAPGTSIPLHSHHGSELTLVLEGEYCDKQGKFTRGDVADPEPGIEHQPRVTGNKPCICLVATDAPLNFRALLPKLLQPILKF